MTILAIIAALSLGLAGTAYGLILAVAVIFPDGSGMGPGPVETANRIVGELLFGKSRGRRPLIARFDPKHYFAGPMLDAARTMPDDDAKALKKALASLPDLNAQGRNGMTLVSLALLLKADDCLAVLAESGAAVNGVAVDPALDAPETGTALFARHTPLSYAAQEENLPLGRVLLKAGADVNAELPLGTPLHYALQYATKDEVDWLDAMLPHGLNVNATDAHNDPALSEAFFAGQYRVVVWLLAHGADPEAPFHTQSGPKPVMRLLLKGGKYTELVTWLPKKYPAAEAAHMLAVLKPFAH